jgi:hypothetical protein
MNCAMNAIPDGQTCGDFCRAMTKSNTIVA